MVSFARFHICCSLSRNFFLTVTCLCCLRLKILNTNYLDGRKVLYPSFHDPIVASKTIIIMISQCDTARGNKHLHKFPSNLNFFLILFSFGTNPILFRAWMQHETLSIMLVFMLNVCRSRSPSITQPASHFIKFMVNFRSSGLGQLMHRKT